VTRSSSRISVPCTPCSVASSRFPPFFFSSFASRLSNPKRHRSPTCRGHGKSRRSRGTRVAAPVRCNVLVRPMAVRACTSRRSRSRDLPKALSPSGRCSGGIRWPFADSASPPCPREGLRSRAPCRFSPPRGGRCPSSLPVRMSHPSAIGRTIRSARWAPRRPGSPGGDSQHHGFRFSLPVLDGDRGAFPDARSNPGGLRNVGHLHKAATASNRDMRRSFPEEARRPARSPAALPLRRLMTPKRSVEPRKRYLPLGPRRPVRAPRPRAPALSTDPPLCPHPPCPVGEKVRDFRPACAYHLSVSPARPG
jgi:hypothetical protein